mmetsp:Transcript_30507/g.85567  ORF Transcript_30507/g.85567 Transcript_30507/m.85567 type:complete len:226 (-) Transcript_30507:349-1026(-)
MDSSKHPKRAHRSRWLTASNRYSRSGSHTLLVSLQATPCQRATRPAKNIWSHESRVDHEGSRWTSSMSLSLLSKASWSEMWRKISSLSSGLLAPMLQISRRESTCRFSWSIRRDGSCNFWPIPMEFDAAISATHHARLNTSKRLSTATSCEKFLLLAERVWTMGSNLFISHSMLCPSLDSGGVLLNALDSPHLQAGYSSPVTESFIPYVFSQVDVCWLTQKAHTQ